MNLSVSFNSQALLKAVNRFRSLATLLVVIGLLGYTAYQVSQAVVVEPDAAAIEKAREDQQVTKIRVDPAVKSYFLERDRPAPEVEQNQLQGGGKADPFSF